jgi:hypothetical protein
MGYLIGALISLPLIFAWVAFRVEMSRRAGARWCPDLGTQFAMAMLAAIGWPLAMLYVGWGTFVDTLMWLRTRGLPQRR